MQDQFLYPVTVRNGDLGTSTPFNMEFKDGVGGGNILPTQSARFPMANTNGRGKQEQGVYFWNGRRWVFGLPYIQLCQSIIGSGDIYVTHSLTGNRDLSVPGSVTTSLYRNGVLQPNAMAFNSTPADVWVAVGYGSAAIASDVKSVNKQFPDGTGNVTITTEDANSATGTTLIVDGGSVTGVVKLKTLVPGSGITFADDPNGNLQISGANQYVLPPAGTTAQTIGGVYVTDTSTGLTLAGDGRLSVNVANNSTRGGIKVDNATFFVNSEYLQIVKATTGRAGIVQVGSGINVDGNGVISVPAAPVQSVSGQTGVVVVQAINNNGATGTSLISDSGATTGNIKLKTIVAGSNVTLAADPNGNLQINAQGNVLSVSDQTGAVVVQTTDNNAATGTSLIVNSGATTANAKLKTLVAGTLITFATDANGNLVINSTATSGALTAVNSEGTGTSLVDNNGTAGGIATIKSLAAGSNITITPSGDAKTLTIAANQVLNPATTTTIGGVIIGAGLNVDGTGKITLAAPTGVNLGGVKAGSGISIAADGTISATGAVASVSGQTGVVVVQATDNNAATGTSLISNSGSTTANIKLKTLVAGSGVTITPDANGNLSIASTATGGVSSITAGTSGALTGAITFTAGPSISLSNTGNSVQISGTGVPEAPNDGNGYMRQNLGWTVVPSIANAITSVTGQTGTGAVLLVESNPPANSAIIKSLVAGQNITLSEANGLVTVTAAIPAGTVSTVNGVSPNGSGNVTLTAANVNAVPVAGNVTMTGPLSMGSQVLNGLTTPTTGDAAVPLSFLQNLTIDGGVIG